MNKQVQIRPAHPAPALVLVTMLLTSLCGCNLINRFHSDTNTPVPVAFDAVPSKQQLLAHLASQSQRIQQIQSDVRVSMDGMPTLRGTLAVEKPDRLRLTAGLLGVSELGVDVGSNSDRFWFWTKVAAPGQEPGIYFANHSEYRHSNLRQMVPVEPAWLIDALGLVEFQSDDRVEGPVQRPDGLVEIRTYRHRGSEQYIRTSVVDPTYGWVLQHAMYDASGRLIAFSDSSDYRHYPEYDVNLPALIKLTAYSQNGDKIQISVTASSYKLNSIYGDPDKLWSMPNPGNVRVINLVTGQEQNAPQSQVGNIDDGRIFDHRARLQTATFANLGKNSIR